MGSNDLGRRSTFRQTRRSSGLGTAASAGHPTRSSQSALICILGLDAVRQKTIYQTSWLSERGFSFKIFTTHQQPDSMQEHPTADIERLQDRSMSRLRQLFLFLRRNRRSLHHVELYVGGRFAVLYAILCRVARVKLMVVERGDLMMCQRRIHPLPTRLSIYGAYRLAHRIWYRELYMERAFRRWGLAARAFLLPNAVPFPPTQAIGVRDIDVLWVNRLIPLRHADWLADALLEISATREVSAEIVGFAPATSARGDVVAVEQYVRDRLAPLPNCRCWEFSDAAPLYRRARFFVLPADYVFCNFALLEAMSHGVVPIVSRVEGADRIVEHGGDGFLVEHSPVGLKRGLAEALAVDQATWNAISGQARKKVQTSFSLDAWGQRLLKEYAAIV